ncbi:MAG: hypothetical protein H8E66_30755 [Planctomycetes bacterium]|nr:hypothetical protein [Planctomycetota bacterium]
MIRFNFVLLCALSTHNLSAAEPLDIGSQRQLFLDDFIVERIDGLTRTMHQPVKRGPVLKAEEPWEGVYIGVFSPPMWIPDEGIFKQVYECRYDKRGQPHRYALATSKDGVHWEKPKLGLVDFEGSKENNLFPTPDNRRLVHVVFDPDDPDPKRRYKGLLTIPRGRVPVVSSDCLHWRKLDAQLPSADAGTMAFDRDKRLFMAMLKRSNPNTVGRSYDVSFSNDFINWSKPRFMFGMDKDRDQKMAIDAIRRRLANPALAKPLFIDPDPAIGWRRPEGTRHIPTWQAECYNFGVIPYEGLYLGLITVYYPTGQRLPERSNADGFNLIQLAMSRDLKEWKRLGHRQPFLEPSPLTKGLVGNYDRLQLAAYNGIIQHEDDVRFYYGGLKRRVPQHSRWPDGSPRDRATLSDSERGDWLEDTHSAMCLAVWRQDGFVSLNAGKEVGELLTKLFIASGTRLMLNVDVRNGGYAKAELLDADNQPLEGFRLRDCIAVETGGIRQVISWKPTADISRLAGKQLRLRFVMKDADLYSFQIHLIEQ